MIHRKPWLIVLVALAGCALVSAQNANEEEEETGGFWPTKTMLMRALDRAVDDMSKHYSFDDDQAAHVSDVLKDRLPTWMNKNRKEIQSLMNQYLEALLDGEPPDPETVAEWAKRVQPLMSEFQGLVEDMSADFGTVMNDDQRVQLEGELAAFNTGFSFMQKKMSVWAEGGYDPETEWPRNNDKAHQQAREEKKAIQEAMDTARDQAKEDARAAYGMDGGGAEAATPVDTTEAPVNESNNKPARESNPKTLRPKAGARDDWEIYVEVFIKKFELKPSQIAQAQKILKSAQDERDNLLRKKADEISKLEKQLREAKSKEDREKVKGELDKAKAPIDRIFSRMESKLFKLPTTSQKKKVLGSDPKPKPEPESAKAETDPAKKESQAAGGGE